MASISDPHHRATDYDAKDGYINALYAPQDRALLHIHAEGERRRAGMQISPQEGKMLHLFATMIAAARILEIGSFMGYSTAWMARALPDGGRLVTIEKDPEHARLAADHMALAGQEAKVDIRIGDGVDVLRALAPDETFDMVFIDAEKRQYPEYLELSLPHIRRGGLIMADNTLLWGLVYEDEPEDKASLNAAQWKAMRAFNQTLADEARFASLLIATPEGMTAAVKK